MKTDRSDIPNRLVRLALGLVLFGVSIAFMLAAGVGVDSWDVFHQGVALLTNMSFGLIAVATSVGVLVVWIPLRQRPGLGTVANAVVVGPVVDLTLRYVATPAQLHGQIAMLVFGVVLNGVATGLYIGAGLGPGPRDGLMTGLALRTGRSIGSVRTAIELLVLSVGWALGGPIGFGTILYAVSIGPLAQFFIARLTLEEVEVSTKPEPTREHVGPTMEACT